MIFDNILSKTKDMKKLLLLSLIAFSCSKEEIKVDCKYPFIEDDYELNYRSTCVILNDTTELNMYFTSYEYLRDSLAHCQPDQTVILCE